jgi:hypothetical protein
MKLIKNRKIEIKTKGKKKGNKKINKKGKNIIKNWNTKR